MKTSNSPIQLVRGALLFTALSAAAPIMAASLALTPTGGAAQTGWASALEVGARISVSSQLAVLGFGYYDFGSDGLLYPHAVTLWDDSGNMIASATVSSLSPIVGGTYAGGAFRFAPMSVALQPGIYRISGCLEGNDFTDPVLFDNYQPGDAPGAFPGIQFLGRAFAPPGSGAGAYPSIVADTVLADWFGPNLLVVTIPEPSSWLLALFGLSAGAAFSRRKTGSSFHKPGPR